VKSAKADFDFSADCDAVTEKAGADQESTGDGLTQSAPSGTRVPAYAVKTNQASAAFFILSPANLHSDLVLICPIHDSGRTKTRTATVVDRRKCLNAKKKWSGREDSNLRPHGPEPCALPG
jgi:hypothetical protein